MNLRTLLAAASLAPALAACSAMPDALHPGPGATLALTASARGVQIYECRAGQWAFVAPQAELFDSAGRAMGTHGAGPFWQAADGSRIVASVTARADAPAAGAIPWLLLAARPAPDSPVTHGLLVGVTHIQRVNTAGGSAPTGACQPQGHPLRVPYRADYHFYKS
ncbi:MULTISPECIES: DUF3455 domain-containing protein [unclassified Roseateles]|uniref:DUF3455 domain-containing protein n=1 Tax=unclassified Roseateles TaxID=2626991 RepID=UPI0006F76E39|nr:MULTISPECIES: DUF3455 domain-containing protein [unclassified Roseateles]KQW42428.1 hypothetical protein ASC81_21485 [Pelomonas sp. Root405]KRA68302.1 hypothetical protein ASD88_23070 [Pelomonas sp. Root662]